MDEWAIASRELASLFSVFGHPDRIRIVEVLRDKELNVKELHHVLGISGSRCSQHIGRLKTLRLLVERPEGRSRYYRLARPELVQWILDGLNFVEARMPEVERINEAISKVQRSATSRNHP